MIQNQSIIKINDFLIKLSFFALPFRYEITSICVFIIFFISLYDIIKNKTNIFKKINFTILFFFLYFIIDLIGIFYSENKSFGIKDLESKLFFLLVPIIFLSNSFKKEIIYKALKLFIVGTVIVLMIQYWHGLLYFLKFNTIPDYVYFSYHIHPTYFSLYLLTCLILLLKQKEYFSTSINLNWIYYTLLIIISVGIILSNSKAGTLAFMIFLTFQFAKFLIKQKKKYLIITLFGLIIISSLGFQQLKSTRLSELKTSFNFPYQTEYNGIYNSTQIRIIIWRSVKEIIQKKPFFGTGTGDIKDELINEFGKIKFLNGINEKYNCHNQFLQIIATFGVIFGGVILIIFIYNIYTYIKNKNYLLITLSLIIAFNFLFESIIENKAGIEFMVLFSMVFSVSRLNGALNSETATLKFN